MIRADVITLIGESAHGVFDTVTQTEREVPAEIKSVTMTEAYEAMSHNLSPEIVFVLSDYAEYQNEKTCTYSGIIYDIIRTYVSGERIELTCQRRAAQ